MENKQAEHHPQKIPGLSLLYAGDSHSTTDMSLLQSTPTSASKEQGNGPVVSEKNTALLGLEEWLKSNPEPESHQTQSKKLKTTSQSPAIAPIAVDPDDKTNWIGKLYEYWALLPEKGTIVEEVLDLPPPHLFTCTITISESPKPFGGPSFPYLGKKNAKQNAAKQAVQYLIETGHIADTAISKEKNPASPASRNQPGTLAVPLEEQSLPAQVSFLAQKLGFVSPSYVLELVPGSTAIYSGYAKFTGEPLIEGKVGEFHNIWAKKAAKEHCAKEVLKFLKGIERHREEAGKVDTSVGDKRKMLNLESPEGKNVAKVSRHDESDEFDEVDGKSEYGTPEPIA